MSSKAVVSAEMVAGTDRDRRVLSLFERTLDNLPDGVMLVGPSRSVLYTNKIFQRLWGFGPGMLPDWEHIVEHIAAQMEHPARFLQEVTRLYGVCESSQDELRLRDGRIISRRSVPFDSEGEKFGRIWIYTDVTEAWNAKIDALTGLKNRRAYARYFPEFAQAADDGLMKAVAIMDVDNFKAYNDIYGHAAGDEVLRRIGSLLSPMVGDEMVFRIGGEEFLIACKYQNEVRAIDFFESIRTGLKSAAIPHRGNGSEMVVTASLGLALFRGSQDPGHLFDAADSALYRSKSSGRNRITLAS
ncbi:MAG TPA: diguanylate cyclase [Devosiaceae bacterium]|nr:diguanylate cyclase [Devosiaceae bacterium]